MPSWEDASKIEDMKGFLLFLVIGVAAFGQTPSVSAGGVLNGVLLRSGLVDEIDIQFLPVVIGRAGAPAIFEGYDLGALGDLRDLELISAETRPDASVFVRYAVRPGGG